MSVFILFQLLTITLIYKIAKSFNPGTALIAALIFSFSVYILERSGNIWPNYAMQPFVNLSFFLLLLAYLRKSYKLLLFSTFIALFAAALQHSAFAMLPLLIIFVFLILKQQDKSIVHYLGVLLTSLVSLLLFYLPPLVFMAKNNLLGSMLPLLSGQIVGGQGEGGIFVQSISEFSQNMLRTLSMLLKIFSFTPNGPYFSSGVALMAVIGLSTIVYFFKKKSLHKKYVFILLFFIAQQIIFVSLLDLTVESKIRLYLIPILGLFTIFIAEIINSVFSKHVILRAFKILLIVLTLNVVSANFYFLYAKPIRLENFQIVSSAVDVLIEEVLRIQKQEGFEDLDFFQIRSFRTGPRNASNEVLWGILEKKLDRKFTTVSGSGARYKEINSRDYIFLVCYDHRKPYDREECKNLFLTRHPKHRVVEQIFSDKVLSIYKTKLMRQDT